MPDPWRVITAPFTGAATTIKGWLPIQVRNKLDEGAVRAEAARKAMADTAALPKPLVDPFGTEALPGLQPYEQPDYQKRLQQYRNIVVGGNSNEWLRSELGLPMGTPDWALDDIRARPDSALKRWPASVGEKYRRIASNLIEAHVKGEPLGVVVDTALMTYLGRVADAVEPPPPPGRNPITSAFTTVFRRLANIPIAPDAFSDDGFVTVGEWWDALWGDDDVPEPPMTGASGYFHNPQAALQYIQHKGLVATFTDLVGFGARATVGLNEVAYAKAAAAILGTSPEIAASFDKYYEQGMTVGEAAYHAYEENYNPIAGGVAGTLEFIALGGAPILRGGVKLAVGTTRMVREAGVVRNVLFGESALPFAETTAGRTVARYADLWADPKNITPTLGTLRTAQDVWDEVAASSKSAVAAVERINTRPADLKGWLTYIPNHLRRPPGSHLINPSGSATRPLDNLIITRERLLADNAGFGTVAMARLQALSGYLDLTAGRVGSVVFAGTQTHPHYLELVTAKSLNAFTDVGGGELTNGVKAFYNVFKGITNEVTEVKLRTGILKESELVSEAEELYAFRDVVLNKDVYGQIKKEVRDRFLKEGDFKGIGVDPAWRQLRGYALVKQGLRDGIDYEVDPLKATFEHLRSVNRTITDADVTKIALDQGLVIDARVVKASKRLLDSKIRAIGKYLAAPAEKVRSKVGTPLTAGQAEMPIPAVTKPVRPVAQPGVQPPIAKATEGVSTGWETGATRPFAFDPNSTVNEGRFRLVAPIQGAKTFSRPSSTPGVRYIMQEQPGGEFVIQAVRFDKKLMSEAQAAQWWEANIERPSKPVVAEATASIAPTAATGQAKAREKLLALGDETINKAVGTTDEARVLADYATQLHGDVAALGPKLRLAEGGFTLGEHGPLWENLVPKDTEVAEGLLKALQHDPEFNVLWRKWKVSGVPAGIRDLANTMRFTSTTLDFSAPFLQGLPLLLSHPTLWAKAASKHYEAFFNPQARTAYLLDNADTARTMVSKGGIELGTTEFTEAIGSKLLSWKVLAPAKGVVTPFQRAFDTFGDVARTELWKALSPLAHSDEELRLVGGFTNHITGTFNSARLGVSSWQRNLEGVMLFSPRYFRAGIAVISDTMQGGLRGTLARNALARLLGVGLAEYLFVGKLLDQEPKLDARSLANGGDGAMFMTYDFNGVRVGPGSFYLQMVRFLSNFVPSDNPLTTGREAFEQNMTDIWRALRAKLGPGPSTGLDILTGRDYIGQNVSRSPEENAFQQFMGYSGYVARRMLPIALQDAAESNVSDKLSLILPAIPGLRQFPTPIFEQISSRNDELVEQHYARFGNVEASQEALLAGRVSAPIDQQGVLGLRKLRLGDPESQRLDEQARLDKTQRGDALDQLFLEVTDAWDVINTKYDALRNEAARSFAASGEGRAFGDRLSDMGKMQSAEFSRVRDDPRYAKVFADLKERAAKLKEDVFAGDLAYLDYASNVAPLTDVAVSEGGFRMPDGSVDWDAREEAVKAIATKYANADFSTEKILEYLTARRTYKADRRIDPLVTERNVASDEYLQDFWAIPKQLYGQFAWYKELKAYLGANSANQVLMARKRPILKIAAKRVGVARKLWRVTHPTADALLADFWDYTPATPQARNILAARRRSRS